MITATQPDNPTFATAIWPTVNDFRVGKATAAVPTPALLPGLVGLGLGVWRKRKQALADAEA